MEIKFPTRKSPSQRLLESVSDILERPAGLKSSRRSRITSALPSVIRAGAPGNPLRGRLPRGNARTTGLIAGGLASLTAGSAGISALRRRKEGTGDHS